MPLSIRYYVLSLDARTSRLFEGFRDTLIDIQNTSFPFEAPSGHAAVKQAPIAEALRDFLNTTDQHLAIYFQQDPLWIILAGEGRHLAFFKSVTRHQSAFIGEMEGDFSDVSAENLGRIAWPIVKHALANTDDRAIEELVKAGETKVIVAGLDAVERSVKSGPASSLFVEEDYRVKVDMFEPENRPALSPRVDGSEALDDAVDLVIESVLARGGNVTFLTSGTMMQFQRIALVELE